MTFRFEYSGFQNDQVDSLLSGHAFVSTRLPIHREAERVTVDHNAFSCPEKNFRSENFVGQPMSAQKHLLGFRKWDVMIWSGQKFSPPR